MSPSVEKVGIFPFVDIVLFPQASLPLYVSDNMYIQLVKDSIEEDFPIAVGIGDPVTDIFGQPIPKLIRPKSTMGVGKATILEELPDGTLYIIIKAFGKVSLGDVVQDQPYLCAQAVMIEDEAHELTLFTKPINRFKKILFDWLDQNIENHDHQQNFIDEIKTPDQIIDYLATFIIQEPKVKQCLLETHSLIERITLIDILLTGGSPERENPFAGNAIVDFETLENSSAAVQ